MSLFPIWIDAISSDSSSGSPSSNSSRVLSFTSGYKKTKGNERKGGKEIRAIKNGELRETL